MTEAAHTEYPPLEISSEVLLRQVHPDQIQTDGRPDSSAFMAKAPHNFLLSTRREAIGAERAYNEWVGERDSDGTYGVSVGEIKSVDLTAFDDSTAPGMPEGHASVDFRGVSDGAARKKARKLRDEAVNRGRLFPPTAAAPGDVSASH